MLRRNRSATETTKNWIQRGREVRVIRAQSCSLLAVGTAGNQEAAGKQLAHWFAVAKSSRKKGARRQRKSRLAKGIPRSRCIALRANPLYFPFCFEEKIFLHRCGTSSNPLHSKIRHRRDRCSKFSSYQPIGRANYSPLPETAAANLINSLSPNPSEG